MEGEDTNEDQIQGSGSEDEEDIVEIGVVDSNNDENSEDNNIVASQSTNQVSTIIHSNQSVN